MINLTPEMIKKAKATKSVEELQALAKESGLEMTNEEATAYYEQLHITTGEMEDDELEDVAGGGCHNKAGDLIVAANNVCDYWICNRCGVQGTDVGVGFLFYREHICEDGYDFVGRLLENAKVIPMVCSECRYGKKKGGLMFRCEHPERRK